MDSPLRIALVAGEASGDILGSGLIRQLKQLHPQAEFVGVGGPLMKAEGLHSLFDMDRLSVMGLWEPLKRLPELLSMRRSLIRRFRELPVDLFVGIDSPDFNLGIAAALKPYGIATAHYVSPSVWAWRQGRVKGIRRNLDLMLTLLPFEAEFYRQYEVPVEFVGHPLASQITASINPQAQRCQLGLGDTPMLLLLPGSRGSEVKHLMPLFERTSEELRRYIPNFQVRVAAANAQREKQINELLDDSSQTRVVCGQTRELIAASDAVLAASGTTTLEVMLSGRPMVIAYKADALSYAIISRMLRVPWVGLPNLIADKSLVPELIQQDARIESLCDALRRCFEDEAWVHSLQQQFGLLSDQLRQPSDQLAAAALNRLLQQRG